MKSLIKPFLLAMILLLSGSGLHAQLAGTWTVVQNQNNANSDQDFAYLEVVEHSFLGFTVVHFYYAEVCYNTRAHKYEIRRTIIGEAYKKGSKYVLMSGNKEALVVTQDASGQFNWQASDGQTGGYLRKDKLNKDDIPDC